MSNQLTRNWTLLFCVAVLLAALFLPCQKVNIRGGWSVGLEGAPIFKTDRVVDVLRQPDSFWWRVGQLAPYAFVMAMIFVRPRSRLDLALGLAGLLTSSNAAFWFYQIGGLVLGRADEVLIGHAVYSTALSALAVAFLLLFISGLRAHKQRPQSPGEGAS